MIELFNTLIHGDLQSILGDLYAPTAASIAAGGVLIALGGVAEMFIHTFTTIFGMGKK